MTMAAPGVSEPEATHLSGASGAENGHSHGPKRETAQRSATPTKGPSRIKRVWNALELDTVTVLLLAKGGIPPALALALLQITVIAKHFTTIG